MGEAKKEKKAVRYLKQFKIALILLPFAVVAVVGARITLRYIGVASHWRASVSKRDTALVLYRTRKEKRDRIIRDRGRIAQNDALRIGYRTKRGRYGAIFSIDEEGTVRRHFPLGADAALTNGRLTFVNASYIPSQPIQTEYFFFIMTTNDAFSVTDVFREAVELSDAPETAARRVKDAFPGMATLSMTVYRESVTH